MFKLIVFDEYMIDLKNKNYTIHLNNWATFIILLLCIINMTNTRRESQRPGDISFYSSIQRRLKMYLVWIFRSGQNQRAFYFEIAMHRGTLLYSPVFATSMVCKDDLRYESSEVTHKHTHTHRPPPFPDKHWAAPHSTVYASLWTELQRWRRALRL